VLVASETDVVTRYGSVRGEPAEGCIRFTGMPYARPPIGALRFRPPFAPDPWTGVFDATSPGRIAPQSPTALAGYVPGDPLEQDEDCLTINVVTPALDGGKRPVLVYIHGGAFLIGTGAGVMYRGDHLARAGVVVVTMNYRLGALGFLAHPALAAAGTNGFGNWGLADQRLALEWVQDHIAAFGGDPANVTVFGESAGAMSIADLLAAPAAAGLFRRAILESGSTLAQTPAAAGAVADRFAQALGQPGISRSFLEAVPVADLLAAQASLLGALGADASMPFQPVVDGGLLPRHPDAVIASGTSNAAQLILGTNRDEFRLFTLGQSQLDELDDEGLRELLRAYLPSDDSIAASDIVATYRDERAAGDRPVSRRELFEVIAGDSVFRIPMLRLASAHARIAPTYCYRFDWESPFANLGLGACHGLELPFVFGTLANPVIALFSGGSPAATALGETMRAAWVSFADCGDPSATGALSWPRYELTERATVIFGPEVRTEFGPDDAERRFWEDRLGRYGSDEVDASGRQPRSDSPSA
jgi:para-nitrobenzyl esterase